MTGKDNKTGLALVATSVLLATTAQLIFRLVMRQHDVVSAGLLDGWHALLATVAILDALILCCGILLYLLSMFVWIFALKTNDVSYAYPMMSVSYVLVFALGVLLPQFDESLSLGKCIAAGLVVAGVYLVSEVASEAPGEVRRSQGRAI